MLLAFAPAAIYAAFFKKKRGASLAQVALCIFLSAVSFGACLALQGILGGIPAFSRSFLLKCLVLNGILEEFFKIAAILPLKSFGNAKKFAFFAGISALTAAALESEAMFLAFPPQNPALWAAARLLTSFPLHFWLSAFAAKHFFEGGRLAWPIAICAVLHGLYDFFAAFSFPAKFASLVPLAVSAFLPLKKGAQNSEK